MTMPNNELLSVTELSPVKDPLSHLSLNTTLAETKVREAAVAIGMDDENRLLAILQRMKEEHVVYAWQLPALESADWKALGFSIGLTAGVRQLSFLQQVSSHSQSLSTQASPSPKSVGDSLLEIDDSDRVDEGVFEDYDEIEEDIFADNEKEEMESLLNSLRRSRETPKARQDNMRSKSFDSGIIGDTDEPDATGRGDKLSLCLFPTGKDNEKKSEQLSACSTNEGMNTWKPCNGSNDGQSTAPTNRGLWRRSSLPLPKMVDLPDDIKRQGKKSPATPPYVANPESDARRFQEEWEEVEAVLGRLSAADYRAVLGQLIIVANGQTQAIRVKLVENVITRLRVIFGQQPLKADDLDLILDHIRHFARLRSDQRKLFGKFLFTSLSRLHSSPAKSTAKVTTTAPQEVAV